MQRWQLKYLMAAVMILDHNLISQESFLLCGEGILHALTKLCGEFGLAHMAMEGFIHN